MRIEPSFQLPPAMSSFAESVDGTFNFIVALSAVFFVGITTVATYFAWKYRRRPGVKAEPTGHNTALEIGWTVAPIFVLIYLFQAGFRGYLDMAVAPADSIEIQARGFQWGWDFEYPNGAHSEKLRVPLGKPVKVVLASKDVLHSFYVPAFRVKKDLVPGMYTSVWFKATALGETDLFCAEYCGGRSTDSVQSGHWSMITKVTVEPVESFEKFLKEGGGPPEGLTVAQWGEQLAGKKACVSCHTVTGAPGAGPTWKGLFAKNETLTDGSSVLADENYLRESMLDPQAKLVKGFGPQMPSYKGILSDKEIDALIAYMKTLK